MQLQPHNFVLLLYNVPSGNLSNLIILYLNKNKINAFLLKEK